MADELPIKSGMIAQFTGYADADNPGEVFQTGDLVYLHKVPKNYMEDVIDCYLAERDGENVLEGKEGEQLYINEFEVISSKNDWLSQLEGNDAEEAVEDTQPEPEESKPKTTKKSSSKAAKKSTKSVKKTTKKTAKKAKTEKVEEESKEVKASELVPYETSQLMDFLNTTDLHDAALKVSKMSSDSDVVLAALLSRIQKDKLYEGYADNFQDYCEQYFEGTVGYRKALYLANSYNFLTEMNMDISYITELGYAKMGFLITASKEYGDALTGNPELVQELIQNGKNMSKQQLKDEIQMRMQIETSNEDVSDEKQSWKTLSMRMPEDMFNVVRDAISLWETTHGSVDTESYVDGQKLYEIVQDWVSLTSAPAPSLENAIRNLEAQHDVKISVDKK